MKINEIIKERRLQKHLTQEQLALALGVSTPAVNKWEKGTSYPDITTLPALARMLDTDLNTLLSFQEDLTKEDINKFINDLIEDAQQHGISHAWAMAMKKIHEYPSCDRLILNAALTLKGFLIMEPKNQDISLHQQIEELLHRCTNSKETEIRNQANQMLIQTYMNNEDLKQAEALLEKLPDAPATDKQRIQASLYYKQGQLDESAKLLENRLLTEANTILAIIDQLMMIAEKQNRKNDADQFCEIHKQLIPILGLWEYGIYSVEFDLAYQRKDANRCMQALRMLIPMMKTDWNFTDSVLYRHLSKKAHSGSMTDIMLPSMIQELQDVNQHELDFLREHPDFHQLMKECKSIMK